MLDDETPNSIYPYELGLKDIGSCKIENTLSVGISLLRMVKKVKKMSELKIEPSEVLVRLDVQEVKHGKWEEIRDAYGQLEGWIHTECGREVKIKENYCPYCGAKMDNM